jgi:hypothetical protein
MRIFIFPLPVYLQARKNKRTSTKEGLNMLTKGGHKVAAGTYWNMMNGERVDLEREGVLPGDRTAMYIKAPSAVMLAAGPVLGLVFAVFLPLIGIVMSLALVGKKLGEAVASAAAGSVSFGWRPIEAYLAGRKRKKETRERKGSKDPEKR